MGAESIYQRIGERVELTLQVGFQLVPGRVGSRRAAHHEVDGPEVTIRCASGLPFLEPTLDAGVMLGDCLVMDGHAESDRRRLRFRSLLLRRPCRIKLSDDDRDPRMV